MREGNVANITSRNFGKIYTVAVRRCASGCKCLAGFAKTRVAERLLDRPANTFATVKGDRGECKHGNGAASSFALDFSDCAISSLSFDREIFPDATCAEIGSCARHPGQSPNGPDIELDARGVLVGPVLATTPVGGGDAEAIGL